MRLYKTISTGIIITMIAVGHVHQRVEIFKAGYGLEKSKEHLSCLVDQNTKLMYNLSKLESPRYLLASLKSEEIEFADHRLKIMNACRLASVHEDVYDALENNSGNGGIVGRFFDLFTLSAEAKSRGSNAGSL